MSRLNWIGEFPGIGFSRVRRLAAGFARSERPKPIANRRSGRALFHAKDEICRPGLAAWWIIAVLLAVLATPTPGFSQEPAGPASGTDDANRGKLVVTFFDMSGGIETPLRMRHLGEAVAIQTPSGAIYLYDTGAAYPFPAPPDAPNAGAGRQTITPQAGQSLLDLKSATHFDTGRDTIAPFLRARGIETIDGIVISHVHGDHQGGGPYLADNFMIRQIIRPVLDLPAHLLLEKRPIRFPIPPLLKRADDFIHRAKAKGAEEIVVTRGDKLHWDPALDIEVLSPPEEFIPSAVCVENANSLVLRVRHGRNVFLFTADAREETQANLLKTYGPDFLRATVMTAPHHGEDTYEPFAQVARPDVLVVSCGTGNASSPVRNVWATRATFASLGTQVYVTPWHGDVEIVSDGTTYAVKTERSAPSETKDQ